MTSSISRREDIIIYLCALLFLLLQILNHKQIIALWTKQRWKRSHRIQQWRSCYLFSWRFSTSTEVIHKEVLLRLTELFTVPIFLFPEGAASFCSITAWGQISWIMNKIFCVVLYMVLRNSFLLTQNVRTKAFFIIGIWRSTKSYPFAWMWINQKLISFLCNFGSVPCYSQKKDGSSFSRSGWMEVPIC